MIQPAQRGFTLIEAVMVIVITGILGAIVAVFLRGPVQGYFDTVVRAELVDEADLALRRIARDLRLALPNSVRVAGGGRYLEFLITSGGGRYRTEVDSAGNGDALSFTAADGAFDVIGPVPPMAAGDSIVVFNLGPGFAPADAYAGGNRAAFGSLAGARVSLGAASQFPFASPASRFQVVQHAVTYECAPDAANPAAGVIRRYWSYGIAAAQPAPPPANAGVGSPALLARNVRACSFAYNAAVATQRLGVVVANLVLEKNNEQVSLFQEAHVSNTP